MGAWLDVLCVRARMLLNWARHGPPASICLRALFAPRALVAAICIETARAHAGCAGWAVEDLAVVGQPLPFDAEQLRKPADDGQYVHGLVLVGAHWDRSVGQLAEQPGGAAGGQSQAQLMPVVWLSASPRASAALTAIAPATALAARPTGSAETAHSGAAAVDGRAAGAVRAGADGARYECPIYASAARTLAHLVAAIELPTAERSDVWVLRGVCLLTHEATF